MNKKIWIPKINYYTRRLSMWQEKLWREVNGKPFMGILDNVAGRKTFEYATFGRSGIQQSNSKLFTIQKIKAPTVQKMTAACVWNASNAIPTAAALTTQIDRAQRQYSVDTGSPPSPVYAYGYASPSSENYLGVSAFGVMDAVTYTDGTSTSRTINGVYYTEPEPPASGSNNDDLFFDLDLTSRPNNDNTMKDITWDDIGGTPQTFTRSSATYTSSVGGATATNWRWLNITPSFADLDANTDFVLTTS